MNSEKGFTLIELIVVIVLLGIMSVGAGMLITKPIEAYNDQLRRQQLVDSAEMAMRKIEMDIRRALPNSIRVTKVAGTWALEMVNTVEGARYRDEVDGAGATATNEILDFTLKDAEFNVLGLFSSWTTLSLPVVFPDYRVVIYNTSATGLNDIYDYATAVTDSGIISYPAGISLTMSAAGGPDQEHHLTLLNGAFQFNLRSPTQRLFIVDGPVSYICAGGFLTRFDGYAYQTSQTAVDTVTELSALSGVNEGRVATQISSCNIDYQAGSPQRSGLITLDLTLTDTQNESVRLLHQVHVDNVP